MRPWLPREHLLTTLSLLTRSGRLTLGTMLGAVRPMTQRQHQRQHQRQQDAYCGLTCSR